MGWLFGWNTRKELVDHLCEGNGVKTLKRKFVGNNMWAVQQSTRTHEPVVRFDKLGKRVVETETTITFAVLYLIKGPAYGNKNYRHGWGYKDVDETMGPYKLDFPVSWLDLLSPCDSEYAVEWRKKVRERAAEMARFKVGTTWRRSDGSTWTIVQRRSPTSLLVEDQWGDRWRMNPKTLLGAEEVTCSGTPTTNAGSAPAACASAQSTSHTAA